MGKREESAVILTGAIDTKYSPIYTEEDACASVLKKMELAAMGMEDRDWYREKRIDWERGGLKERNEKRRLAPKYAWWILATVLLMIAAVLFRSLS